MFTKEEFADVQSNMTNLLTNKKFIILYIFIFFIFLGISIYIYYNYIHPKIFHNYKPNHEKRLYAHRKRINVHRFIVNVAL